MKKDLYTVNKLNIPQFKFSEEDSLNFFNHYGFHIEENIINKETCENLIKSSIHFNNSLNKTYQPEMQLHKENKEILNFMKNTIITSIVKKIIGCGKSVYGLQSSFFYGISGTTGSAKHQDSLYTSPESADSFLSVWVPLVDINRSNMGNLYVYNETHKLGSLNTKEIEKKKLSFQNKNLATIETVFEDKNSSKNILTVKCGSLVFLHSNLVHGSLDNQSRNNRYALLLTYIRDGVKFREGKEAKRIKIKLD